LFKRILQEPLLHFLVVGSLLFFYLSSNDTTTKSQIVITEGKIKQLTAQFTKTRQREPLEDELTALIDHQIREDLAFEHGVQMGLVENDSIIKRRVKQKIEFMLNDSIAGIEPNKEELQKYLYTHKETYMVAPVYDFEHIYINPEKHEDTDAYIEKLKMIVLNDISTHNGDSIMLERKFTQVNTAQVARLFGRKFAQGLDAIVESTWQGPIQSGYGYHLVKINRKIPAHVPTLDEVEATIKRDYRNDTQKSAIDSFYEELKNQYTVTIEKDVK
jgi:hypothetical protein